MEKVLMNVRVPKELRQRVKARVALMDTTIEAVVTGLLEKWLEETDDKEGSKNGERS